MKYNYYVYTFTGTDENRNALVYYAWNRCPADINPFTHAKETNREYIYIPNPYNNNEAARVKLSGVEIFKNEKTAKAVDIMRNAEHRYKLHPDTIDGEPVPLF